MPVCATGLWVLKGVCCMSCANVARAVGLLRRLELLLICVLHEMVVAEVMCFRV